MKGLGERLSAMHGLDARPPSEAPQGFRVKSDFHFTAMLHRTSRSPFGWLMDAAWLRSRRRRIERAAAAYQRQLLEVNAARITNDFRDRVTESRRRLERQLRDTLHALVDSADTALAWARRAHAAGTEAVKSRIDLIESLRHRVDALANGGHDEAGGRFA